MASAPVLSALEFLLPVLNKNVAQGENADYQI